MNYFKRNYSSESTWPSDCNYMLAIDESGTSEIKRVNKMLIRGIPDDGQQLYFLSGIIVKKEDLPKITKLILELKRKYWENGFYCNKRVVFHSKDLVHRSGAFNKRTINDFDSFCFDLCACIKEMPFKSITIGINKYKHIFSYGNKAFDIDEYLTKILFERYAFFLNKESSRGNIMFESKNGPEDDRRKRTVYQTLNKGTRFVRNDTFDCINDYLYFFPKRSEDNQKSYFLLELADMVAYFSRKKFLGKDSIKDNNLNGIYASLETKIIGYPDKNLMLGRGIKYL